MRGLHRLGVVAVVSTSLLTTGCAGAGPAGARAVPSLGAITPVPGGVGPMTIAMLLRNTLTAAGLAAKA